MANQIFCFQIKRTPWMAQFVAQFFPDCVVRVCSSAQPSRNFFINQHGEIFSRILLTGNQMISVVKFALGARAILLVFQKIYSSYLFQIALEIKVYLRDITLRSSLIAAVPQ